MSVIAQDVFVMAMNLMDEETQDGTFAGYSSEYKKKAWSILTMLQAELLPPLATPLAITSEASVFQIDDKLCVSAMPYGLAAHLLMNEDQNRAAFFNARYDELKRKQPIMIKAIEDIYGIFTGEPTNEPASDGLSGYDGGSFLDPNTGLYDGGEF
jgi:hypothetical protein